MSSEDTSRLPLRSPKLDHCRSEYKVIRVLCEQSHGKRTCKLASTYMARDHFTHIDPPMTFLLSSPLAVEEAFWRLHFFHFEVQSLPAL